VLTATGYAVCSKENAQHKEEVKEMTKYYFRIGRYFLSTSVLTGFGLNLSNWNSGAFPRVERGYKSRLRSRPFSSHPL
jgi:hypothetical protein